MKKILSIALMMASVSSFAEYDYDVNRFDGHYILKSVKRAKVLTIDYIKKKDKWVLIDTTNEAQGKETISWVCPAEFVITSEIKGETYEGAPERIIHLGTPSSLHMWNTYDLNLSRRDPLLLKLATLNSVSFGESIYSSSETSFGSRERNGMGVVEKRSFAKLKNNVYRYSRSQKTVGFENKLGVMAGWDIPFARFDVTCDYTKE